MCYSNPAKSLEIARSRMTAEQWERFEADFDHFCAYSGFPILFGKSISTHEEWTQYEWARWAYFKGRTRSLVEDNTQRIRSAHFERIGLAMMSDEQAEASLQRWKERQ